MPDDLINENRPRYDADHIARFFDEYGHREWKRLTATPVDEISLYIHTHYLKQTIPAGSYVLEIGAGPGRFTQVLSELGARIIVADISPGQLALNEENARKYGFSHAVKRWQQVDICDMKIFTDQMFDFVVAYGGPLSYVIDQRDAALSECWRVLKPGGLLLFSVMSLWGSIHRFLDYIMEIPMSVNRMVIQSGDLSADTFDNEGHHMHMFRSAELRHWLEDSGWEIIALSASNALSTGWEELLQQVKADEEKWNALLQVELEACAEDESLNMGTHLIAVVRKPSLG